MVTGQKAGVPAILILNGTSSSGKTSLLHALQDRFEEPFLDMGIDRFIYSMPERYLERPLWDDVLGHADRAGEEGHRLVAGMHRCIAALARAGSSVVADHVLVEAAWVQDCANLLAGMRAYLIGVRCPLEVVEERERARKTRTLGQARLQFNRVHQFCVYDVEVDTALSSPVECAEQIRAWLEAGHPPEALRRIAESSVPPG